MYQLIIKGSKEQAASALESRGLLASSIVAAGSISCPCAVARVEAGHATLADWFSVDLGSAPRFLPGSLLHFAECAS